MYRVATDAPIDLEEYRARLRKMRSAELIRFGKAARYMCSPTAYFGNAPRETFVIQLQECREEWKRREAAKLIDAYGVFTADC
jgi:hypothetical protein